MDSVTRDTHVTFLDTVGRPAVIFKKTGVTDNHTGAIYVSLSYTLDLAKRSLHCFLCRLPTESPSPPI